MGDASPEVNLDIIEPALLVLLSLALAIGSIRGRTRFYYSAVAHFLLGVTGGIVGLLALYNPESFGERSKLFVMILMAFVLVWMATRSFVHFTDIDKSLKGYGTEPRPFLAITSWVAACMAGITSLKLGLFIVLTLEGAWANLFLTIIVLMQVAFYLLAAMMIGAVVVAGIDYFKKYLAYRKQRGSDGPTGS